MVGKPDPERTEIVKAFVVLKQGFEPTAALTDELQQYVSGGSRRTPIPARSSLWRRSPKRQAARSRGLSCEARRGRAFVIASEAIQQRSRPFALDRHGGKSRLAMTAAANLALCVPSSASAAMKAKLAWTRDVTAAIWQECNEFSILSAAISPCRRHWKILIKIVGTYERREQDDGYFYPGMALSGAVILAASPALAADMYRAPAPASYKDMPYVSLDWSGFYAGVNGGYAFDSQNHPAMKDEGGFGGGQIGYNWQGALLSPNLVLGVEADFQGAGIDHSTAITCNNGDAGTHRRANRRVRHGARPARLCAGPTLVYFTGGFAYGNKTNEFTDSVTGAVYKDDGWKAGYVLGGGAEYKFNPAWSVKAEYRFIDLGPRTNRDGTGAGTSASTVDTELSTVRAWCGNYHFGSTYAPLK